MANLSQKNKNFLAKLGDLKSRQHSIDQNDIESEVNSNDLTLQIKKTLALLHVFDWAEISEAYTEPKVDKYPNVAHFQLETNSFRPLGHKNRYARSLNEDIRRKWLTFVSSIDEALKILSLFPNRIQTPTQKLFEKLLREDGDFNYTLMSPPQLKTLQTAGRWANQISNGLFSETTIKKSLPISNILFPFQHLLSEQFVGREKFEDKLRKFTKFRASKKRSWPFSLLARERVMLIEGVGGVGKTSLLGRFLIDIWHNQEKVPLPFSYLACDDKTLNIRSLHSFVTAIQQDLVDMNQYLGRNAKKIISSEAFHETEAELESALNSASLSGTRSGVRGPSTHMTLEGRIAEERGQRQSTVAILGRLIDEVARIFGQAAETEYSFLLVIDSFEEAQYRTEEFQEPFWNFLEELLTSSEHLKIIIVGRPPIKKGGFAQKQDVQTLSDLTTENAKHLLELETGRQAAEFGPLIEQIGRNPLNLRLAARIIKDEIDEKKALKGIKSSHLGWLKVGPEVIRGQLYQRLLDHIKDDRVRQLAHPGMILRRVTPEIIRKVLAKVCDFGEISAEDALTLYNELSFEHTLVSIEADGSLRYRPDVREPVLKLLKQDKESMVRKCHQAAKDYYSAKPDDISQIEYLYHDLMLGNIPNPNDPVWNPTLVRQLEGSLNELPIESKAWLATQARMRISKKEIKNVTLKERERIIGREALTALNHRGPKAALEDLKSLKTRSPDSALHAIEIRSLMSLGQLKKARKKLAKIINDYPALGNKGRLIELLWLNAQCLTRQGNMVEALKSFDTLIKYTTETDHRVSTIQALSAKLAILKRDNDNENDKYKNDRIDASEKLKAQMENLSQEEITENIGIVRFAFGKLNQGHALSLIHIGRAVVSQLYDIIAQPSRWAFDLEYFKIMQDKAQSKMPQTRENMALADTIQNITKDNKVATHELISTLNAVHYALSPSEVSENLPDSRAGQSHLDIANNALGMTSVWALTNMELGDFSSATISGIDDYRDDWEREDFFSESFLA